MSRWERDSTEPSDAEVQRLVEGEAPWRERAAHATEPLEAEVQALLRRRRAPRG